jgi:hypothetical protein
MRPVFILGNVRSGTTIFHRTLLQAIEHATDVDCSDQESRPFWKKHGFKFGTALTGTYCCAATETSIGEDKKVRIRRAFRRLASRGVRVITKNPHFCNKLPLLHDLFPDALYLHIVREDLSVVASMKRGLTNLYHGDGPWGTSCVHYWPAGDRPCWSVLSRQQPSVRQILWEKLRRLKRYGVLIESPDFVDWREFRREHPDPTRYFPGQGFCRLEESWIQSNLNIVLDIEKLGLRDQYLAINYQSFVERPDTIFQHLSEFLGVSRRPGFEFSGLSLNRQDKWREELSGDELEACSSQRRLFQSQVNRLSRELPGPLFAAF